MSPRSQLFNHNTPAPPTLGGGMLLDTAGVKMRRLQALGSVGAVGSGLGNFSDVNGYGQTDWDNNNGLLVADTDNSRLQRFVKDANGEWVFHSSITATTLFGSALHPSLLAFDRVKNEIHVGCWDQTKLDGTFIGVWDFSLGFAGMTSGNRVRSYANNSAASDAAGRSFVGLGLGIDSTFAIICSLFGGRVLVWNHITGALVSEVVKANSYARFATDGAGNWWSGGTTGAAEPGVWKMNVPALTGASRLDISHLTQETRRQRISGDLHHGVTFSPSGVIYVRSSFDTVQGFFADGTYKDEYLWAGGMGNASPHFGHGPGLMNGLGGRLLAKHKVISCNGVEEYLTWASTAQNNNTQSFLLSWQTTVATATWTKSDFSPGVNTLMHMCLFGTDVGSEKCKVEVQKNAGGFVTIPYQSLGDPAVWGAFSFTQGDLLTLKLSLSQWDRLDNHPTLYSAHNKIPPSQVAAMLTWDDSLLTIGEPTNLIAGDVYVDASM